MFLMNGKSAFQIFKKYSFLSSTSGLNFFQPIPSALNSNLNYLTMIDFNAVTPASHSAKAC